jgi:hypothetical protein
MTSDWLILANKIILKSVILEVLSAIILIMIMKTLDVVMAIEITNFNLMFKNIDQDF